MGFRVCGLYIKEWGTCAPVRFRNVLEDETTYLPFDITRLVANWNLYNKNEKGKLVSKDEQ